MLWENTVDLEHVNYFEMGEIRLLVRFARELCEQHFPIFPLYVYCTENLLTEQCNVQVFDERGNV